MAANPRRQRSTKRPRRGAHPQLAIPVPAPGLRLIEDQILDSLKAREEERCRREEAALRAAGTPAVVKRREITKPWTRSGLGLCLDLDLLQLVTAFDYDLRRPGFAEYCARRGRLHVAGEPGGWRRSFFEDLGRSEGEFREKHTGADARLQWEIIMLGRAMLQDCWELWVDRDRR